VSLNCMAQLELFMGGEPEAADAHLWGVQVGCTGAHLLTYGPNARKGCHVPFVTSYCCQDNITWCCVC